MRARCGRRCLLRPRRPRVLRRRLRGDRRQADDHGAGHRQRRPGARGLLALRDQGRDSTEPGGGRYGVLLRGTQVTQLKKIRVVFFDVQGEEGSTLTAKRGTYRWQDGSMEANGNVLVVSPDGRRLKTEIAQVRQRREHHLDQRALHLRPGQRAPRGQQLPLGPGLQERRHRPAARRGRRRDAAAGARRRRK